MANFLITHTKDHASDAAGWHERQILNDKKIAELENPDEQSGDRPVRSIPSPFAPMHLAKEAMLQYVHLNGRVSPDTKRVISDALDVGILFFELAERTESVDALYFSWESIDVRATHHAGSHRLNAALRLFRKEDGDQYGLNSIDQLHLLTVKDKPQLVFGGTCPETMFFAAPGDKAFGQVATIGDDILFDHKYCLLHERADDYVRWYYALYAELRDQRIVDTAFCKYLKFTLEKELERTRPALANEIAARLTREPDGEYYKKKYKPLSDAQGHDILLAKGVSLRGQNATLGEVESSFHMAVAPGRRHPRMPLAIPQSASGASSYLLIEGESYNRDKHRPPHVDFKALGERSLPGLGTKKYPYLTTDDFLEATLFRLPYPIDARFWFSVRHPQGSAGAVEMHDYLLPLKPMFFKYFTAAELLSSEAGTPRVSIGLLEDGYTEFTLEIPLANGGSASFSRRYFPNPTAAQDGSSGVRRTITFGLGMFPSYLDRDRPEHQRLILNTKLSDRHTSPAGIELFDSESADLVTGAPYEVDWSRDGEHKTVTYQPASRFDGVVLTTNIGGERGVLLPRLRNKQGSEKLVFSVDFGTTNTHIEVARQAAMVGALSGPTPAGYTALLHAFVEENSATRSVGHVSRAFLINNGLITYQTTPEELFPTRVGREHKVKFPVRTASVENKNAISLPAVASHTIAVPWAYPLKPYHGYTVSTNLKWSTRATQERTQKRATAFIHTLCLMMRAYTLENHGDLDQVELVWFYPTSMQRFEIDNLEQTWTKAFKLHFSDNAAAKVKSLPESLAPIYAWRREENVSIEDRPTIIADIGGGTCDITIFQAERGQPKVRRVSSYRFAGNTIFGDGKGVTQRNGFVTAFLNKVTAAKGKIASPDFADNDVDALAITQGELDRFAGENQSIELINYWFSLSGSQEVPEDFDFASLIQGTPYMRVPFVIYFAALAFKIASDMAALAIEPPKYLAFSGNGARMLKFLSTSNRGLEDFFDAAFKAARPSTDPSVRLKVFATDNPKPLTARGGLYYMATPEELDPLWDQQKEKSLTVSQATNPETVQQEVNFYGEFVDFLRRFTQGYDITNQLGISRSDLEVAITILADLRDARGHMDEIAIELSAGMGQDEPIARQMFFFPLQRMLPEIARRLAENHNR